VPACCWGRSIDRQHALSARFDDGPAAPPAETKKPEDVHVPAGHCRLHARAADFGLRARPLTEENLCRAMRVSAGDPMIFLNYHHPWAEIASALLLAIPAICGKCEEAFQE
jgi:hypothetical protein